MSEPQRFISTQYANSYPFCLRITDIVNITQNMFSWHLLAQEKKKKMFRITAIEVILVVLLNVFHLILAKRPRSNMLSSLIC
jgi:hypothetical protein